MDDLVTTTTTTGSRPERSCPICLEDFDDPEVGLECIKLSICQHEFCRTCLQQHCQYSLEIKHVPIPCPRVDTCHASIPLHTAEKVLPASELPKLLKYHTLLTNSNIEECPHCNSLLSVQTETPDARCSVCSRAFCLVHGASHAGMSCSEYQKTPEAKAVAETERVLDLHTKKCSRCGCRLQKKAGCNFVVCGHCHRDMCWQCGTHKYLTNERLRICTQCKQKHGNIIETHPIGFYMCLPFRCIYATLIVVAWMTLATILAIVTCCFGGCFACGRWLPESGHGMRHGTMATVATVFLPIFAVLDELGLYDAPPIVTELFDYENREIPFLPTTKTGVTEEPTEPAEESHSH